MCIRDKLRVNDVGALSHRRLSSHNSNSTSARWVQCMRDITDNFDTDCHAVQTNDLGQGQYLNDAFQTFLWRGSFGAPFTPLSACTSFCLRNWWNRYSHGVRGNARCGGAQRLRITKHYQDGHGRQRNYGTALNKVNLNPVKKKLFSRQPQSSQCCS